MIPVKKDKGVTSRVYTKEILLEVQEHYTKHQHLPHAPDLSPRDLVMFPK